MFILTKVRIKIDSNLKIKQLLSKEGKFNFRRVRKITKSDYYIRHVCRSVRHSARKDSGPTGRVFMKSEI